MKDDSTFELYGHFIGETDLFARNQPADLEGPQETWLLTRDIIDQGCTMLRYLRFVDPISTWRVQAVAALFRRILITAEAIRLLISKGLDEPALSTSRTLLELEVNLRLVINDSSDMMARRLAFFYFVRGRRHFLHTTRDNDTRDLLQEDSRHWGWTIDMSRLFKTGLKSGDFDDIREKYENSTYWHGFANQRDAFQEVGMIADYHTIFDSTSSFVHASNIDYDLSDTEGKLNLKPLVQRDPGTNITRLGWLTLNLLEIYELVVKETGQPEYEERTVTLVAEDGSSEQIRALDALKARALEAFPLREEVR